MSDIAIRVEHLSKRYRLGQREQVAYRTLREAVSDVFLSPLRRLRTAAQRANMPTGERENGYIWALRDVSFEVKRGEVVGIIGRNGAGKTTLLKILSRITEPTEGYAEIHGRVGSLLEVGTGFHPELTGRENIYLNGAILGMKKAEIDRYFDEIVEFAEIEKFLDTPVKRYSSGMYVRLAFAVAAHLQPEILLVDEVLAVGDAAFQKKCLGKMGDVAKEGRTVLFVSHNMAAVRSLCSRSVLLDKGQVIVDGPTEVTVTRYLMSTAADLPASVDTSHLPRPSNITSSDLRITRISILNGSEQAIVFSGKPFELALEFVASKPLTEVVFGWSVHSNDNVRLFECRSVERIGVIPHLEPGEYVIQTSLPANPLNPGLYTLYVGARCANKGLDYLPGIMNFQVELADRQESSWLEARSGALSLDAEWTKPIRDREQEG